MSKVAKCTMCGREFEDKRTVEEKFLDGVAGEVSCPDCRDEVLQKVKEIMMRRKGTER